jgi:YegS/Rv2252/BmrU family lipid kinase
MNPAPIRRRVVVLANPRSGPSWSFGAVRQAVDRWWERPDTDVKYQFTQSASDGAAKARRCIEEGADTVLVVGGDGTVSSIGCALVGTPAALGAVPVGSGNGFARHFDIPLAPDRAVQALAGAVVQPVDVGLVNGRPFFVTCSMAWDASIVRSFEKMPVRGFLPYLLAGAQELIGYRPQPVEVRVDDRAPLHIADPLVFTVANLTQFGGGARIAPHARHDDGLLQLVVALRQDGPKLLANLLRLFDGSLQQLPEVQFHSFRRLLVRRAQAAPIQIDGELVDAPAEVEFAVRPGALNVLVPA